MSEFIKHYNGYIIEVSTIAQGVLRYRIIDELTYQRLFVSEEISGKTQQQVCAMAVEKLKSEIFS